MKDKIAALPPEPKREDFDYGEDWGQLSLTTFLCARTEWLEARNKLLAEALREVMGRIEWYNHGKTHWDGCEELHDDCKAIKNARAVLAACEVKDNE